MPTLFSTQRVRSLWGYDIAPFHNDPADRIFHVFYHVILGNYLSKERWVVEEDYETIDFPFEEIASPPVDLTQSGHAGHIAC